MKRSHVHHKIGEQGRHDGIIISSGGARGGDGSGKGWGMGDMVVVMMVVVYGVR